MDAADKYIQFKLKKQMEEGGEMEEPQMQETMIEEETEDDSYEVTMQDDSGLVKYKFSKNIII